MENQDFYKFRKELQNQVILLNGCIEIKFSTLKLIIGGWLFKQQEVFDYVQTLIELFCKMQKCHFGSNTLYIKTMRLHKKKYRWENLN